MKRGTRLYCHECDGKFTVRLDYGLNGNHKITCPKCGHIHYRVIENGKVTGDRYRSSMDVFSYSTTLSTSFYIAASSTAPITTVYFSDLWADTATA